LGSVNVASLVSGWGAVATVPTTTALTLAPLTGIAHGSSENVTVNITVTPKNGTATGTVSLLAQSSAGTTVSVGEFTLGTNGSVSGTTTNLPGGANYPVYAHYSGDGVNAPSDSTSQTVSVAPESSKTFIVIPTFDPTTGSQVNGNVTSVTYGTPYFIRMYVTNSGGAANAIGAPTGACRQSSSVACASGTVTLTANGQGVDRVNGIFQLNDIGYTRDLSPVLAGGSYNLAATYSGDTSYQASNTSDTFTVNLAPTTLAKPNFSSPALVGTAADLSIALTTQAFVGVAPTGKVTFFDGGTPLTGPISVSSTPPNNGTPAGLSEDFFPTFSTPGNHVITANYGGDANYAAATTAASTNVSVVYHTTISVSVSPATVNYGQSVMVTATISSQAKNPPITGEVQLTVPGSTISNVTMTPGTDANGNQILTATGSVVPQASGTVTASYSGDSNYESKFSNFANVNVNTPDFVLSPANGLNLVPVAGQAGSTQITITPASQIPSSVTLTLQQVFIAGYTISLTQQQVQLNGVPVTVTLSMTPTGTTPGNAIRKTVRRAGFIGEVQREWWTVSLSAGIGLMFLIGMPGRRKRLRAALGLGLVCLVSFGQGCGGGGGSSGGGGGGGGGTTPHATSVSLTTSNAKVNQNDPLTITATVSGGQTISGTVTFYDYGVQLTNALPVTTAQPQVQIGSGSLVLGVHQLTAKYSGDSNNLPSTSQSIGQTVTGTLSDSIGAQTGVISHSVSVTIGVQ